MSIVPNKTSYNVGEPVIVQLVGDPQGASDHAIFARLRFNASILNGQGVVAMTPTSGVSIPWTSGAHNCGSGFCDALNAVGPLHPATVNQTGSQVWATVTLQAVAPGSLSLTLETLGPPPPTGSDLDFFGLTSVPAVPIQVVAAPVPAANGLALGLLVLLLVAGTAWVLRARRPHLS